MSLIRLYSWVLEWLDTTQMAMVVQKQQMSNINTSPNYFCWNNFPQKSLSGGVLDQALLLAVGVAGHHPDGHGCPETTNFKHHYHPQQLLLLQLCSKITSWGCPWSGSNPGCWSGWTPPRWALSSRNVLKSLHWWSSLSLINGIMPKNQSPSG